MLKHRFAVLVLSWHKFEVLNTGVVHASVVVFVLQPMVHFLRSKLLFFHIYLCGRIILMILLWNSNGNKYSRIG